MKTLKAALCFLVCLSVFPALSPAADAVEVVYFEGAPRLRGSDGTLSVLDYGTPIQVGASVITGRADQAELDDGGRATIRVKPNTVFTIRELETAGRKEPVLTAAVGAISLRFSKLAGREPRVGSVGTVAGIRGTELTIYAGPDGSTLFIVDSGLVSVETDDGVVELSQNEGMEVSAAGLAGEKFSALGRELDYAAWAEDKTQAFIADPLGALAEIALTLNRLRAGLDEWTALYRAAKTESDAAAQTMNAMTDKTEQEKYRDESWAPLAHQTATAVLNYRYYALSAFSLRRYVLSPLYTRMRSLNLVKAAPGYRDFMDAYASLLDEYAAAFSPYLNSTDY